MQRGLETCRDAAQRRAWVALWGEYLLAPIEDDAAGELHSPAASEPSTPYVSPLLSSDSNTERAGENRGPQ
jgi:hypothetical protein